MTLIAIILALIIERIIGGAHLLHNFTWFERWAAALESRLPDGAPPALCFALVVLPLLLVLWLLQYLLSDWLWGLAGFALDVLVLSACLGPRLLDSDVDDYLNAREQGDAQAIDRTQRQLTGKNRAESLSAEVQALTESVFYQANLRWYAVIFWFLLAGAGGVALYRLTLLLCADHRAAGQLARQVYGVLGWLPARISALYFGLMGSMDEALYALQSAHRSQTDWAEGNRRVLAHTGCAAINMEMPPQHDASQDLSWARAANWVRRARGLCLRVLMLWLATVALFTLMGWMM
ncbi:MAG: hypothetical protein CSA54_02605 [Gammaproteobacteria bacterium]|nr:MAG: hypothetical protein CSA54_02605 [Gammaproteobacteria bacterium]